MRHKNGHEDRAVITTSYRRDLKLLTYLFNQTGHQQRSFGPSTYVFLGFTMMAHGAQSILGNILLIDAV